MILKFGKNILLILKTENTSFKYLFKLINSEATLFLLKTRGNVLLILKFDEATLLISEARHYIFY